MEKYFRFVPLVLLICVFCATSRISEAAPSRDEIFRIITRDDVHALDEALAVGLDPNGAFDPNGLTYLVCAILSNSSGVVQKLIVSGADVNMRSDVGMPLHIALNVRQNTESVSKLEVKGKIISLLLERGANVNTLNELGDSPLNLAASGGDLKFSLEMARKLIGRGANVNSKNDFSLTPLHDAFTVFILDAPEGEPQTLESRAPLVALLLVSGADVHTRSIDGETPLFYALDDLESVKLLLDAGARVDVKNKKGETPFDVARRESPAAAKLLFTQIGK